MSSCEETGYMQESSRWPIVWWINFFPFAMPSGRWILGMHTWSYWSTLAPRTVCGIQRCSGIGEGLEALSNGLNSESYGAALDANQGHCIQEWSCNRPGLHSPFSYPARFLLCGSNAQISYLAVDKNSECVHWGSYLLNLDFLGGYL
jgi:hypothetical protein